MAVWIEILNERFGITHVDDVTVLFAIGDVTEDEIYETIHFIEHRAARQHVKREAEQIATEIEQKREARQQIEAAGYDTEQIPL